MAGGKFYDQPESVLPEVLGDQDAQIHKSVQVPGRDAGGVFEVYRGGGCMEARGEVGQTTDSLGQLLKIQDWLLERLDIICGAVVWFMPLK